MRVRVDIGFRTVQVALGLCECGYRTLAVGADDAHGEALAALARHETTAHPDDRHARAALAALTRRRKERAETPDS